jgi:hypothetical protein
MSVVPVMFRWARHVAWGLLGAGFLVLVAGALWGRAWGPVAIGLIAGGYCVGVIAVLPILGQTLRAGVEALAAFVRRARLRSSAR